MNDSVGRRLEAAREVAGVYRDNPRCTAVGLIGSMSRGTSDIYSDVDLLVIWADRPGIEERLATLSRLSDAPVFNWAEGGSVAAFRPAFCRSGGVLTEIWPDFSADPDGLRIRERFHRRGLKFGVIGLIQEDIGPTLAHLAGLDDLSDLQMLYRNSLHRVVAIEGADVFDVWRDAARKYPAKMVQATIERNANVSEDWWLRRVLAARADRFMLRLTLDDLVDRIHRLIFAANHINFPDTRFKWSATRLSECEVKPRGAEERIRRLISADPVGVVDEAEELAIDTLDMLEDRGYSADFDYFRARIRYEIGAWEPESNPRSPR